MILRRFALPFAAAALALPGLASAADLKLDCVVDPSRRVNIGSPVSGLIAEVRPARGDFVEAGDVVARIEAGVEQASVALGRVQAESTEDIEAQQTRLHLAESKYSRVSALRESGSVSAEQIEQAEADVEIARRELARLQLQKRIAELELARSEAVLSEHTIVSPISGLISQRRLSPGEFVTGDSPLMTVVALDPLYVETFVPVAEWGRIEAGSPGLVTLEQPVGGSHEARVTVVDRLFDAASGTFGVRLELPNPDHSLPAGLRCTVSFALPG